MTKTNKYKDLFFDIESGQLKPTKPDIDSRDDTSSIITTMIDHPEARGIDLHSYANSARVPILSLGVTHKFLEENCLKPGDRCQRFKAASYSDGKIQYVMCRDGPFKRCEKAKGGR